MPSWAPDGTITYRFEGDKSPGIFRRPVCGDVPATRLTTFAASPYDWTPDGRTLVFNQPDTAGNNGGIFALTVNDGGGPRAVVSTSAQDVGASLSPDGRWLAYTSDDTGGFEVYVQPFPGPGARQPVSVNGGAFPAWSGDGRQIFFTSRPGRTVTMFAATVSGTDRLTIGVPRELFTGQYVNHTALRSWDVDPGGQRFVLLQQGAPTAAPQPIADMHIVINWTEELKRLVPTN
jgi:serine/threonine-protein kinase